MNNNIWILMIIGVILLLLLCSGKEGYKPGMPVDVPIKSDISVFPEIDTNLWPYYYYSFPYNNKYGGAWPPGMYSRLYYWSPGFYTGSGQSISMRPGIGYKYWPSDRWIRNTRFGDKGNYYNVTNNDDGIHDAANYDGLPQVFPL